MIRNDPAITATVVAKPTGIVDPDFVEEVSGISPKYCAALLPEYIMSMMKFVRTLKTLGYFSQTVGENEIIDVP